MKIKKLISFRLNVMDDSRSKLNSSSEAANSKGKYKTAAWNSRANHFNPIIPSNDAERDALKARIIESQSKSNSRY